LIEDADAAVNQAKRLVIEGRVWSTTGKDVHVRADTLCIHGDQAGALLFVKRIRTELEREGVAISALRNAPF